MAFLFLKFPWNFCHSNFITGNFLKKIFFFRPPVTILAITPYPSLLLHSFMFVSLSFLFLCFAPPLLLRLVRNCAPWTLASDSHIKALQKVSCSMKVCLLQPPAFQHGVDLLWAELSSQNFYVEVPIPSISEWDCLEIGSLKR